MNEIISLSYNLTQNTGRWLLTTVGNDGIGTLTFLIETREMPIYLAMMQNQSGAQNLFQHFTTSGQDELLVFDFTGEGFTINFAIQEIAPGGAVNPFLAANELKRATSVPSAQSNRVKYVGVDGAIIEDGVLSTFTCLLPKLGGLNFAADYTIVTVGASTSGVLSAIAQGLNWFVTFTAQSSVSTNNVPASLVFEKIL